jgi:hypothetical protein
MNNTKANNKYDWAVFAYSFLLIAKLACQELLLDEGQKKHNKATPPPNTPYKPADLFISIVFNIKHGIEVFIKTLGIFAYGTYNDNSHNIHSLFEDAKTKISQLELKPIKTTGDTVSQKDIDNLPEDLNKIEELIEYFFTLDFLKSKIGTYHKIIDIKNDVFRYPDNSATVQITWDSVLHNQINEDDIKKLLEKLDQVYKLFSDKGYLFSVLDGRRTLNKE